MIPTEVYEQTLLSLLAPVRAYLDDPRVTEIMINGPERIYVERAGKLERVEARFASEEALMSAVRNIAQYVGRPVGPFHSILEGHLPDGSRVEAVLPPAASCGPSIAIRRFSKEKLTMTKLLEFGSLSQGAFDLLRALVMAKMNIIVAGGTGSGKTSMLNALSSFIPSGDRIVVIEDARELQLQQEHVVQLEARPADSRGRGQVTIRDLFRATLRMRPDRIVVGEIRAGEALELIQAMTSGHGGCLSTVHATYPLDTLCRLETMALMSSVELPLFALRAQISSAVNIVVQTARLRDGARAVTHITEVLGAHPERGYQLADLYVRKVEGEDARGKLLSRFLPTGELPTCTEYLSIMGYRLPEEMFAARRARPGTP
jgi:pilus assembly protein CpaF